SMKSCASRMRATSGAYVFTNSHNAFMRPPCGAPITSLPPAAKYNCRGDVELNSFDLVAGCAPRIKAARQRAHAHEAPVHQHAGDTRRAGFVRSRTVDDDVAVWRQLRHVLVEIMDVNGNGAGHAPRIDFPRRLGAHIDDDGRRPLPHQPVKVVHRDA